MFVLSLELPHRGDSYEYTTTHYQYKKKITQITPNTIILQQCDIFVRDSRTSSNSRGKRAISVRAIEILLYNKIKFQTLVRIQRLV